MRNPGDWWPAFSTGWATLSIGISLTAFPMLSPLTLYNLIIGVIGVFQYFGPAYLLSKSSAGAGGVIGAPLKSTLFYSLYLFNVAIERLRMGYASALAWVLAFGGFVWIYAPLLMRRTT